MQLRRLECFLAVAEELHFGRAADRLDMAQPPLSQQIRALESELGLQLFERTTRRVALTEAGRALVDHARSVVRASDELVRSMAGVKDGSGGVLRLGFVDSASYDRLPRFLQDFGEIAPNVRFELRSLSSDQQRAAIHAGELDLGIARTPGPVADLEMTMLEPERLIVALSAEHPLADRTRVELTDLAGVTFLGFDRRASPSLFAEMASLFARRSMSYDPAIEAGEYTTVLGLAAAGLGVALAPASVRSFAPAGLRYLDLADPDAVSRMVLLSRPDPSPIVATAIEIATRTLAGGASPPPAG